MLRVSIFKIYFIFGYVYAIMNVCIMYVSMYMWMQVPTYATWGYQIPCSWSHRPLWTDLGVGNRTQVFSKGSITLKCWAIPTAPVTLFRAWNKALPLWVGTGLLWGWEVESGVGLKRFHGRNQPQDSQRLRGELKNGFLFMSLSFFFCSNRARIILK